MTRVTCPLQPEMDALLSQSQDFFAAVRRLRRRCKACPAYTRPTASVSANCPFWLDFNAQIRQATSEVIAELSK